MATPRVRIVSTGGTIASTGDDGGPGKTPTESGRAVLEAVPELEGVAEVDVDDVCRVSGFQVTFAHQATVLDAVERAREDGVDGVVITHGTDTMAETAVAVGLASEAAAEAPVVCTGAQRPADHPGTDGPSNLTLAVRTAADERFRAVGGSYLAFDDEVHAADRVVKAHTSRLGTFTSPETGPVADWTPDGFRFLRELDAHEASIPGARPDPDVRVDLVTNAAGVGGRQVEAALDDGVDGLVVAGTGLGNTTEALGEALETAVDAGVPVVLASRCHAGPTAGQYGGPGGGATLLAAGAIPAGDVQPWTARIALALACSAGEDVDAIRDRFPLPKGDDSGSTP